MVFENSQSQEHQGEGASDSAASAVSLVRPLRSESVESFDKIDLTYSMRILLAKSTGSALRILCFYNLLILTRTDWTKNERF